MTRQFSGKSLPFLFVVATLAATLASPAQASGPGRIAVFGATGFIGQQLVKSLVADGREVVATGRSTDKLAGLLPKHAKGIKVDLDSGEGLKQALKGTKVAYYLVHSMEGNSSKGFVEREAACATRFAKAAKAAGVQRVVYVGGIQPDGDKASDHLRSRDQVAKLLAKHGPPTTTLQMSLVLGKGTHCLKMLEGLYRRLPVLGLPSQTVNVKSQPVALEDVIFYLKGVLRKPETAGKTYEVGGKDVTTYRKLVRTYAAKFGLKPPVLSVPMPLKFAAERILPVASGMPRGLVAPVAKGTAETLLVHPNKSITRVFPEHKPLSLDQALTNSARGTVVKPPSIRGAASALVRGARQITRLPIRAR